MDFRPRPCPRGWKWTRSGCRSAATSGRGPGTRRHPLGPAGDGPSVDGQGWFRSLEARGLAGVTTDDDLSMTGSAGHGLGTTAVHRGPASRPGGSGTGPAGTPGCGEGGSGATGASGAGTAHRSARCESGPGSLANGTMVNGDQNVTNNIVAGAQPIGSDSPGSYQSVGGLVWPTRPRARLARGSERRQGPSFVRHQVRAMA